jgi:hypothetical protein
MYAFCATYAWKYKLHSFLFLLVFLVALVGISFHGEADSCACMLVTNGAVV